GAGKSDDLPGAVGPGVLEGLRHPGHTDPRGATVLHQAATWSGPGSRGEGRSTDRLGLHLAVQPHRSAGGIDPVRLDERGAAAGVATGGPARRRRTGAARGGRCRDPGAVVRPAAGGITRSTSPKWWREKLKRVR